MKRTLQPSTEIENQIERLLANGVTEGDAGPLTELGRLGARLIIQRAVEEECDAFLGRARYERSLNAPPGSRNGYRPRKLASAEGSIKVEIPQVRGAAEPFVSKLFPRGERFLKTEPLKALIIGGFVRGLSMRDVESLCEEAGIGKVSKSTASRICKELRERYAAFCRRDLSSVRLVALLMDAIYLPVRPAGAKEGVIVAWGITTGGERVLLATALGMHESEEDWMSIGRDLMSRGLRSPLMVVADGAPGLSKAIEQLWPTADRQRCTVHRLRNLLAKLPQRERDRVRGRYWEALEDATDATDGRQRMARLIGELQDGGFTSAAACLADDLDALVVHLKYPRAHRKRWRSTNLLERSLGEVRRRTKVIGRFPGESSCLSLCFSVLDLVISHSNKVKFSDIDIQAFDRIERERTQTVSEEVMAA